MNTSELAPIREDQHMRVSRLEDSLFSKELAPHYMQLATKLASSDLVPKCFRGKPQDLFLCWAMGYQVGLTPEQSMQCIAVINGKPAMWGDDMLALCMAHKDFVDIIENPIKDSAGNTVGYRCTVKRLGKADKINEFTMDMAKKAGLLAKGGVWAQYPERMLKLRARGFCLRDSFPDALKGIKPREEVEDYIEADYKVMDNLSSRTEQLKKDYTLKQGAHNVETVVGSDASMEDRGADLSDGKDNEVESQETNREEAVKVHLKLERLLAEKGVTQERIDKALKYYEVESLAQLTEELAQDFINKISSKDTA
jgi:hypothetical protein